MARSRGLPESREKIPGKNEPHGESRRSRELFRPRDQALIKRTNSVPAPQTTRLLADVIERVAESGSSVSGRSTASAEHPGTDDED